jgi:outer membrane protein OmpA-like peptidoglycan-associated protein
MIPRKHSLLVSTLGAALLGLSALPACGHAPTPPELVDARAAYQRAQSGPASQYKPDQLHEAQTALTRAEQSYLDYPSNQRTRDLAYVAQRKAELADVQGRDAKEAADKAQAETVLEQATQAQLAQTQAQLNRTGQQLAGTEQQLAAEKTARAAADQRAQAALDRLAAANNVQHESRGTVITIPGSVLFASGKSVLLPTAQQKLDEVVDALKDQEDHQILVEGHTDSTGPLSFNEQLSQSRAQAVRDYLVSRGVPSDRIRAQGFGPSQPVADNGTSEGRANNRRVEIIVQPIEAK